MLYRRLQGGEIESNSILYLFTCLLKNPKTIYKIRVSKERNKLIIIQFNSLLFMWPQGQLQTEHSVDSSNYIMDNISIIIIKQEFSLLNEALYNNRVLYEII
jgi:hypothetical protein